MAISIEQIAAGINAKAGFVQVVVEGDKVVFRTTKDGSDVSVSAYADGDHWRLETIGCNDQLDEASTLYSSPGDPDDEVLFNVVHCFLRDVVCVLYGYSVLCNPPD
jgi:hypothetical protein